jgi:hypothetical protein
MTKEDLTCLLTILLTEANNDLKKDYYVKHPQEYLYRSFEKWTYLKLIELTNDSFEDANVCVIVEDFCNRMNKYSLVNSKTSYMFSTAYDVAMNIYDLVILTEDDPYYKNEYTDQIKLLNDIKESKNEV